MKSGNYNGLLDKFYAGTATAEEISLLKLEGLINEQDIIYAETLRQERAQKMHWEFEDFMNDIPSKKVVTFSARKVWVKRMLSAAAVVAAIVTAYIFWPQPQTNKIANVPASNKVVDTDKDVTAATVLPANEIKDSMVTTKKINPLAKRNTSGFVTTGKKTAGQKGKKPAGKMDANNNADLQNNLVIVNGKPVTNEADAVAITRKSLGIVSRNLALTIDELKPISRIKIKL